MPYFTKNEGIKNNEPLRKKQQKSIDIVSECMYNYIDTMSEYPVWIGGNTMPKGSLELTNARKDEIVSACAKLYETMSFKEITIKEIGNVTSFTRTSIYNYFETKEEIFLALFQKEYELWVESLNALINNNNELCKDEAISLFARSLADRRTLLKLLSMNLYDMEENSRLENLVFFKEAYGASLDAVNRYLLKFVPYMSSEEIKSFIYSFFPFMFGIYPYTVVTEKQEKAMKKVGIDFKEYSIYEIIYNCVKKLLGGNGNE
jgi:AcrR family transcriptional regulator